jgi:N-acetylglucosamine-6-sulfatase
MSATGRPPEGSTGPRTLAAIALALALAAAAALALAGPGRGSPIPSRAAAAEPPPNVVVIETDDQTLESMRVMENVDSLIGAQGATFANSFVNISLCCPSRATFLTGQYAHNHGVWSNVAPDGGFQRFHSLHARNNLAVWLRRAGYHTAMIGKYLNQYRNKPRLPPGWSEWQAVAPEPYRPYNYILNDNGKLVHFGQRPADYEQDVLTRKAVGLIDRRAPEAQPFFLWLTYSVPHGGGPYHDPNLPSNCGNAPKPPRRHAHAFDSEPLPRPPSFDEPRVSDKPAVIRKRARLVPSTVAYIERNYRCELESLLAVDDGVKKVVAALKARGELAETLIVYTSDNGFFHGEHRIAQGKMRLYEESIRVPLVIRGPGVPKGVTIGSPALNADLAPTIVDAADAEPGLVMDGRSLLPVAKTPRVGRGRQLLIEQPSFEAIRTRRYVYAEHGNGERELYDLKRDPYQLKSRHRDPAYASVQGELAARLDLLRGCAGLACRIQRPEPASP